MSYFCKKAANCNNGNCAHSVDHEKKIVHVTMRDEQTAYCTKLHFCPSMGRSVRCGRIPSDDKSYLERLGLTKKGIGGRPW